MKREEILRGITEQFEISAKQLCADTCGDICEISKEYKGEEESALALKCCVASIYYRAFVVKLIYTAHGTMSVVNSILGCSIRMDKTKDAVEMPLPLVSDYCDIDTATPMFIPWITNKEGMEQAVECVGEVLKQVLQKFQASDFENELKEVLLASFFKEQKDIFGADEVWEPSFEAIYDLLQMRTTTGPFITFLKGKHEKAIRKLSKQKKLFGYESRVLKLWKAGERFEISRLSFVTENLKLLGDDGTSNGDVKELGGLFLAWLVITPFTSAFFLGLYLLLMWIEKIGSVYLMGPMYNLPFCFCFGFLTAIALSYFARFAVYKLISKKNYKKNREMDSVQNGAGADKLMKGFAVVLTVAGMIGCLLTVKHNINFLPDGFIDNSKLLSLKGEFHSYDDIKRVYYKADRENDFGETLDFPSFVIVLQNGKEIDLYEHGDIADYEERLKVLFEEHGIQVEQSDSQKNSH